MVNNCPNMLTASEHNCPECMNPCSQRTGCNMCCQHQCQFLNDQTYTILRKFCHKILKHYNRSKCREKYTIFDGGNSINVRIHRSSSRASGDVNNQKHEKIFKEDSYNTYSKQNSDVGENRRIPKQILNKSRRIEGVDIDTDISDREQELKGSDYNSVKTKRDRSKNKADKKDVVRADDIFDQRRQNTKGTKHGSGREDFINQKYDETVPTRKRTFNQDVDEKIKDSREKDNKRNRKVKNIKRTGENDDDDVEDEDQNYKKTVKRKFRRSFNRKEDASRDIEMENRRSKSKKGNVESIRTKKRERDLIDDNESDIDEKEKNQKKLGRSGRRQYGRKSQHGYKDNADINDVMTKNAKTKYKETDNGDTNDDVMKKKFKNVKTKYKEMQADENTSDDEIYNKQRKSIKGRKSKGFIINKSKGKNYISVQGFDNVNNTRKGRSSRIFTDLRNKIRRGDKFGLYESSFHRTNKFDKFVNQRTESFYYTRNKLSRADEVKTCDYLRAHMEERELCNRSHCPTQANDHMCIPEICVPNSFSNSNIFCFSETCKC